MIKYKKAESPGWYYKIDTATGQKISFNEGKPKTMSAGLYKEMLAWVAAGNEIEPQYTAEELAEKETNDFNSSIEVQKSTCVNLLNESEKAVSNDPPYPADIEAWKTFRASLRTILKSTKLETIPEKPFSA